MKKCTKCGEEKPLDAFYFEKRRDKSKPRGSCKECQKAAVYARREANPERTAEIAANFRERHRERLAAQERERRAREGEKINAKRRADRAAAPDSVRAREKATRDKKREHYRQKHREWYRANRDHMRDWAKAWREANPERQAEYARKHRERNWSKVRSHNSMRYALRRGRRVGQIRAEVIDRAELYSAYDGRCAICKVKLPTKGWHMDHIVAIHIGGHHVRSNVQPTCPTCNCRKGTGLDVRRWTPKPVRTPGSG